VLANSSIMPRGVTQPINQRFEHARRFYRKRERNAN
jgi:hypothetical protein